MIGAVVVAGGRRWCWCWTVLVVFCWIGQQHFVAYNEAFVVAHYRPTIIQIGCGEASSPSCDSARRRRSRPRRPATMTTTRQRSLWGDRNHPVVGPLGASTGSTSSSLPLENYTTAVQLMEGVEAADLSSCSLSSSSSSLLIGNNNNNNNININNTPPAEAAKKMNGVIVGPEEEEEAPVVRAVQQPKKTKRVAVLLNLNARSVTDATVELARQVFLQRGDDHDDDDNDDETTTTKAAVYVTRTEAEALAIAPRLLECDIVVPIGGDGTLTYCLNLMKQQQQPLATATTITMKRRFPDIAYIPLGTGNAVGSVAGCVRNQRRRPSQLLATMELIRQAAACIDDYDDNAAVPYSVLELPMLEVQMTIANRVSAESSTTATTTTNTTTTLCFFCGAGFDSLMLNDFRQLQQWLSLSTSSRHRRRYYIPSVVRQWLGSVAGYCVALVTRTLPAAALRQRHLVNVKITTPLSSSSSNNTTNRVWWLDHRRGDVAQRVGLRGGGDDNDDDQHDQNTNQDIVLYQGRAGIVAASTVPYYGGKLRLFPFARVGGLDQMHLRIGRIHPLTGMINLRRIFAGTYRDPSDRLGVLDYLGQEFHVQFLSNNNNDPESSSSSSYPFQHSGESVGEITSFRLKVADQPIRFVSFWDQQGKRG